MLAGPEVISEIVGDVPPVLELRGEDWYFLVTEQQGCPAPELREDALACGIIAVSPYDDSPHIFRATLRGTVLQWTAYDQETGRPVS